MRMPHDFEQEGREVEPHEGDAAAHRDEVERFRQRQQATGSPSRRRRPRGMALVGLLIVGAIVYVTCETLDESEQAPPTPPVGPR